MRSTWQNHRTRGREWLTRMAEQGIVMVVIATVMLTLFAKVGEEVLGRESTTFDNAVHSWVVAHQSPALFHVSRIVSLVGSGGPVMLAALILAVWLWRIRGRRIAAVVAISAIAATMIPTIIKRSFHRIRPPGALRFHMESYSFPSGHSTGAAAIFVAVAYILVREKLIPRWAGIALGVIGPLLIGLSRVYLDVHWATDVLGGWAAGLFVAALGAALYERLRRARRPLADLENSSP